MSLLQADLLPTINHAQIVAGGSLNNHLSAFFAPDGKPIGEYSHATLFAEYIEGGWIALSKQRLARLTVNGSKIWSIAVDTTESWLFGAQQPIIECDGYIFMQKEEASCVSMTRDEKLLKCHCPKFLDFVLSVLSLTAFWVTPTKMSCFWDMLECYGSGIKFIVKNGTLISYE